MELETELQFLAPGLLVGSLIALFFGTTAGGAAMITYGAGGMMRDKQHTGEWFP